jgi:hypothetical protein
MTCYDGSRACHEGGVVAQRAGCDPVLKMCHLSSIIRPRAMTRYDGSRACQKGGVVAQRAGCDPVLKEVPL